MTPDDQRGTDTEWDWRVYPKGSRSGRKAQPSTQRPSVVVTPPGTIRFNKATRMWLGDDESDDGPEYVRYLVAEDERLVGFEAADEDDPNAYSLGDSGSASFQAVLTSFDLDKPDDSVLIELQSDDSPVPYIDVDEVRRGYDDDGGDGE